MIKEVKLGSVSTESTLEFQVMDVVKTFQRKGLHVEIQYSYKDGAHLAMVIARDYDWIGSNS